MKVGDVKINILAFADDLAVIASSRKDLQKLLDMVYCYSRKWRFLFNVSKCKILVFSRKRSRVEGESLYLGVEKLEQVASYKYLGVEFQADLKWSLMRERVVKKARAKLAMISKASREGLAPITSVKLWRVLVQPIMEYAVEIWGSQRWPEAESVQLEVGRMILGVSGKTASDAVRGELGWQMGGRVKLAILRWWGKLVRMDHDRLCYKIYRYRRSKIKENCSSWCRSVRDLLISLKLDHIWMSENTGGEKAWVGNVKSWLDDRETEEWRERVMDTPKLRLYCNLKTELRMEDYLTDITDFQCRRAFTRIRVGTHELRIETGRYRKPKEDIKDRICCVCCKGLVEDEQHLLLDCISYESLRRRMMIDKVANRRTV